MKKVNTILEHKNYSTNILNEFRNESLEIQELKENNDLCLFATGCFARNEANANSCGIDVFYIRSGNVEKNLIDFDSKKIIDSNISNIVKKTKLLPLIDDEETLKAVYSDDLLLNIGTKREDIQGSFNIRMLFLLESQFIYNEDLYDSIAKQIIHNYFNDFDKHIENFNAVYLVNDIIKYWKIHSYNYEHKKSGDDNYDLHNEWLLFKNLKLEFSRKLTCYSFILQILLDPQTKIEDRLFTIFKMTPLERMESLGQKKLELSLQVNDIIELYSWYLELFNLPFDDLFKYLKEEKNVKNAFDKGEVFSQKILELLLSLTKDNPYVLKYLFV